MLTDSLTFPRVKFHTQGLFGLGHLAQRKAQNHANLCVCCTSVLWECEDSWNPQRCIVCQKAYALLRGSLNQKTHTDRKFDFLLHWSPPLSPASLYPASSCTAIFDLLTKVPFNPWLCSTPGTFQSHFWLLKNTELKCRHTCVCKYIYFLKKLVKSSPSCPPAQKVIITWDLKEDMQLAAKPCSVNERSVQNTSMKDTDESGE